MHTIRDWVFVVPRWCPPSINQVIGGHWSKLNKLKGQLSNLLGAHAVAAGVPRVSYTYRPRRAIGLTVKGWGNGATMPDEDNLLKLFLDSARRCGLIVDDRKDWVEWSKPLLLRSDHDEAVVSVADLELRPACKPEQDPYTRSLLNALKAKTNRRRKRNGT